MPGLLRLRAQNLIQLSTTDQIEIAVVNRADVPVSDAQVMWQASGLEPS